MPSFVESDGPDQQFLLPPDAREWLPRGHLAWRLREAAAEIDLAPFLAVYRSDGRSRPAYHPRAMLTLIMYCYCKAIRSSRSIEAACYDDLGARVIVGNVQPDHATIARFVTRHREAIQALLTQTLVIAARNGLVSVEVIAGDGTIVKANASVAANVTADQLQVDIAELEQMLDVEVASWFDQHAANDTAEDALFDAGDDTNNTAAPLKRTMDTLRRRRAAGEQLEQRRREQGGSQRERAEKTAQALEDRERGWQRALAEQQAKNEDWQARNRQGNGLPGTRPVEPGQHTVVRRAKEAVDKARSRHAQAQAAADQAAANVKINTTDPASRVMKGKHGQIEQSRNVQVHAEKNQLIVHIGCHDNPNDVDALHTGLGAARANLNAAGITDPIRVALYDAGYASDSNFTTPCPDPETELLVAITKEARQTGRQRDRAPREPQLQSWRAMADKLATDHGKTLYKKRAAIIEPIFGQMFTRLGRYLNYRGPNVDTELHLCAVSHNILKIIRHRSAPAT